MNKLPLLIDVFTNLSKIETNRGRYYPSQAFNKVVNILKTAVAWKESCGVILIKDKLGNYNKLGPSSSEVFIDVMKNGFSMRLETDKDYLHPELSDLYRVQGLGDVKVDKLMKSGITSIELLNKLNLSIGDFIADSGVRYTQQIDSGIKTCLKTSSDRITYEVGNFMINKLFDIFIKEYGYHSGLEFMAMGSYRRKKSTLGDLDIVIFDDDYPDSNVIEFFSKHLENIFVKGPTKVSGSINGVQVDIRIINSIYRGAHILHSTGSREFNVKLRGIAKSKGYSLNEYNIVRLSDNKEFNFRYEEDIFEFLGIQYVKPEDR
jgi:DNA polymerase (family 10)